MGVLKDIERLIVSADDINDAGVPTISMALIDGMSGDIQSSVITNGTENTDTLYQACSISKAITSLAVARLIDLGKLSYETKVVEVVPYTHWQPIVDFKTEHLMEHVTIGMLVSHRSGFSQHGFPGYAGDPPAVERVVNGKPPANTPRLRFLSFPGSQVSYSGGGFTLLQIALEHISGQPFAELLQDLVLGPLGMTRSRYGDLPAEEHNYAAAHATAYVRGTLYTPGYHRFVELAAAGLWTTPTDLLKAVSAVQRSLHTPDGFLKQDTADAMLGKPSPDNSDLSMAMGWGVDKTFFAHRGGNDPGYACYCIGSHAPVAIGVPGQQRLTTTHMSMAIMTNSELGYPVLQKILAAVFTLRSWPLFDTLPCHFGKMTDLVPYAGPEGVNIGDLWKKLVGSWTVAESKSSRSNTPTGSGPSTPATLAPEDIQSVYEVYDDNGTPMIAFDGVSRPMRLRIGTMPWWHIDGRSMSTFIVDGLEMAVRIINELDGTQRAELIMDTVQQLKRA